MRRELGGMLQIWSFHEGVARGFPDGSAAPVVGISNLWISRFAREAYGLGKKYLCDSQHHSCEIS